MKPDGSSLVRSARHGHWIRKKESRPQTVELPGDGPRITRYHCTPETVHIEELGEAELEKPLDKMSPKEIEDFHMNHAVELGIFPVGRDGQGVMKFRFRNIPEPANGDNE